MIVSGLAGPVPSMRGRQEPDTDGYALAHPHIDRSVRPPSRTTAGTGWNYRQPRDEGSGPVPQGMVARDALRTGSPTRTARLGTQAAVGVGGDGQGRAEAGGVL